MAAKQTKSEKARHEAQTPDEAAIAERVEALPATVASDAASVVNANEPLPHSAAVAEAEAIEAAAVEQMRQQPTGVVAATSGEATAVLSAYGPTHSRPPEAAPAALEPPAAPEGVATAKIVTTAPSVQVNRVGYPAGTEMTVARDEADRLVKAGHARRA